VKGALQNVEEVVDENILEYCNLDKLVCVFSSICCPALPFHPLAKTLNSTPQRAPERGSTIGWFQGGMSHSISTQSQ
jgi:hypothetical protein